MTFQGTVDIGPRTTVGRGQRRSTNMDVLERQLDTRPRRSDTEHEHSKDPLFKFCGLTGEAHSRDVDMMTGALCVD